MIYDGERNKLIGTAIFTLTTIAEQKLLQLVNHGIKPSSLILMNLNLYQPAKNYIPPNNSNYSYERKGIIYELFTESETGRDTPVSIQMKYKTRPQVITLKNLKLQ